MVTLASVKARIVAPTLHWLGLRSGFSSWLASRQRVFRILLCARLARLSGSERREFAREVGAPDHEPDALESWMKSLRFGRRRGVEAALRARPPGFEASPQERMAFDTMKWEELRRLDPELITVGSHTMTHPILTRLDPQDVCAEIVDSKRILEDRLGRAVDYFCYPNGAYDSITVDCVRAQHSAAVTTDDGPSSSSFHQRNFLWSACGSCPSQVG
jgi:hypothetical protein